MASWDFGNTLTHLMQIKRTGSEAYIQPPAVKEEPIAEEIKTPSVSPLYIKEIPVVESKPVVPLMAPLEPCTSVESGSSQKKSRRGKILSKLFPPK
jgi:hypothetical protein